MHANADTSCLGDVLQKVHLLAVEADAVDLVALAQIGQRPVLFDLGRDAIGQSVLGTLRRVDNSKPFRGSAGEGGEIVRDGAGVAVVPVRNQASILPVPRSCTCVAPPNGWGQPQPLAEVLQTAAASVSGCCSCALLTSIVDPPQALPSPARWWRRRCRRAQGKCRASHRVARKGAINFSQDGIDDACGSGR